MDNRLASTEPSGFENSYMPHVILGNDCRSHRRNSSIKKLSFGNVKSNGNGPLLRDISLRNHHFTNIKFNDQGWSFDALRCVAVFCVLHMCIRSGGVNKQNGFFFRSGMTDDIWWLKNLIDRFSGCWALLRLNVKRFSELELNITANEWQQEWSIKQVEIYIFQSQTIKKGSCCLVGRE